MKFKQNTHSSLLRKIGSLLLTGSLLISSLAFMASCTGLNHPHDETTADPGVTEAPIIPEEHLITSADGIYVLMSPDKSLMLNFFTAGGMSYAVTQIDDNGNTVDWVRASKLGVRLDRSNQLYGSNATVVDASVSEVKRTFPLLGNQSSITDHCLELVLTLEQDGYTYYLDARAYNNGVAFRYRIPDNGNARKLTDELTTYSLRQDIEQAWYGVNSQDYEAVIGVHSPTEVSGEPITAPLTAVVKNRTGYISIMEGALTESYSGVNLTAKGDYTYGTTLFTRAEDVEGDMVSGWRLINIADNLNDLVNNYNIYCVNEPTDETIYADTSWIEPGRSAWSWNVDKKAPTYNQMLEYTEMAAELGFEYNIIDEGWHQWSDYKSKLTDIGTLGEQYDVKQVLWGAIQRDANRADSMQTEEGVDIFFDLMKEAHLYGAKIDFWWSETLTKTTDLQKYVLTEAAKRQYVINFHGCNKNSGLNATFPNELSREGVRGHENIGNSDSTNYETYANWLNAQLYTRFLCGHADWTPAIQSAMQIGSIICIDSPFMAISYDPAKILTSPAVEFIKSIPTVWDKTVVLSDSVIGAYSAYAKQKDGVWFVGGITSMNKPKATVDLSEFITDDGTYTAEIWTGVGNSLKSQTMTVTKDDVIDIGKLESSEGFAIRLTKLSLSQYGGKINGAITVTAPDGATVKYTTDGSDPRTSDTAVAANGSITLNESCRLKVAITDGDGKGTMLSYQFNKMD